MTAGRRQHYKTVKSKGRYRSLYERRIAAYLSSKLIKFEYEGLVIDYFRPAVNTVICPTCGPIKGMVSRRYTPDFKLHNNVIIEAKGRFTSADRAKMRAVIKQHPELDIRLLFMRDNVIKGAAGKETSYTEWATIYGFPSAIGPEVPDDWLAGRNRPTRLEKAYKEL